MLNFKSTLLFVFASSFILCGCEEEKSATSLPDNGVREPEAVAEAVKEIKTLNEIPAEARE